MRGELKRQRQVEKKRGFTFQARVSPKLPLETNMRKSRVAALLKSMKETRQRRQDILYHTSRELEPQKAIVFSKPHDFSTPITDQTK